MENYKKISDLTVEEITSLPQFVVSYVRNKGKNYTSYEAKLSLHKLLVLKDKKLKESQFNNFILRLGISPERNEIPVTSRVRFVTGEAPSKIVDGEMTNYWMAQAIIVRKADYSIIRSFFLTKTEIDTLNLLIEKNEIPKIEWIHKDVITNDLEVISEELE